MIAMYESSLSIESSSTCTRTYTNYADDDMPNAISASHHIYGHPSLSSIGIAMKCATLSELKPPYLVRTLRLVALDIALSPETIELSEEHNLCMLASQLKNPPQCDLWVALLPQIPRSLQTLAP